MRKRLGDGPVKVPFEKRVRLLPVVADYTDGRGHDYVVIGGGLSTS